MSEWEKQERRGGSEEGERSRSSKECVQSLLAVLVLPLLFFTLAASARPWLRFCATSSTWLRAAACCCSCRAASSSSSWSARARAASASESIFCEVFFFLITFLFSFRLFGSFPLLMASTIPFQLVFPTELVDLIDSAWMGDIMPQDGEKRRNARER